MSTHDCVAARSIASESARRLLSPRRGARTSKPRACARVCVRAAARSNTHLYELLGVSSTATTKEIKSAYRKRALKLHPDVNKAPDAAEKFNEVKQAYNVLVDPKLREAYDAASTGKKSGSASDWSDAWSRATSGARTSSSSSSGYYGGGFGGSKPKEEEFYGFKDFFADLEKELDARAAKRPSDAAPKTLWEELYDIGEEFVEFLETTAPKPSKKEDREPSSKYDEPKPKPSKPRKPSAKDQTVDDMLAELKRDMGL